MCSVGADKCSGRKSWRNSRRNLLFVCVSELRGQSIIVIDAIKWFALFFKSISTS